jgi:hypothetical protein
MLALAFLAVTQVQFHFVGSEFSNAVYHVGCLTGRLPCTNSLFVKFWNEDHRASKTDGANLDEFKAIMQRVEDAAPSAVAAPFLANYAGFYPALRVRTSIMAAALESNSGKSFASRTSKVLSLEDRQRIGAIFDHFKQRLHPWWISTGKKVATSKLSLMRAQMKKMKGEALASEMAAFLESNFSSKHVYLHAIPSPFPKSPDATANPIGNHFCMEVIDKVDGPGSAAIALHELVHSFYDSAPTERHIELMNQFVNSTEPTAQSYYEFLNEAIATGAQLLLLERNGIKEDDPYHDPFIPRLAKSIVPELKDALQKKTTLFNGFHANYLRAGSAELGAEAKSAHFWLQSTGILTSEKNKVLETDFREQVRPRFTVTREDELKQFSNLNAVRLMTYDELPSTPQVLSSLRSHRGFVYVTPRGSKAKEFFVAGRDQAAIRDLLKKLVSEKQLPESGLVLSIE